jgi:hypothetical protein
MHVSDDGVHESCLDGQTGGLRRAGDRPSDLGVGHVSHQHGSAGNQAGEVRALGAAVHVIGAKRDDDVVTHLGEGDQLAQEGGPFDGVERGPDLFELVHDHDHRFGRVRRSR